MLINVIHAAVYLPRIDILAGKVLHARCVIFKHGVMQGKNFFYAAAPVHLPDVKIAQVEGFFRSHAALDAEAAGQCDGCHKKVLVVLQRIVRQRAGGRPFEHPFAHGQRFHVATPDKFILAHIFIISMVTVILFPVLERETLQRFVYFPVDRHSNPPRQLIKMLKKQ